MIRMLLRKAKGFTLIELLLAVSISTIVISLVTYALLQTLQQFSYTVDHSSLRQEASIMAATIEQKYLDLEEEDNNQFNIELMSENQLVIGDTAVQLHDYHLYIKAEETYTSNGEELETFSITSAPDCVSTCSGETICSTSDPTLGDLLTIYNQTRYNIHIHLFSKEKPCDDFEIITNLSKV